MSRIEQDVAAIVQRHIEAGNITGGVTLLAICDEVEFINAQGAGGGAQPAMLQPDSIFAMMSMTKTVAAACAASLAADGKLPLSAPVSRWLPSFATPRQVRTLARGEAPPPFYFGGPPPIARYDLAPASREITVHDLLSGTSGLQTIGVFNPDIRMPAPDDTLASWVDSLGCAPLDFEPGSRWGYSNFVGFDIIGRLVELASGQSFDQFAQARIFGPLRMDDTGFGIRDGIEGRLVPPEIPAAMARTDFPSGSAGLVSTASDYARFARMLLGGGLFEGQRVLPSAAVDMMTRNQIGGLGFPGVRAVQYTALDGTPSVAARYGYGVAIIDEPSEELVLPKGSFGWDGLGTRRFWVIPKWNAVLVILMPGLGSVADGAHAEIEAAVAAALG